MAKRLEGLYDIHCHLVPYVDDGADTLEVSKALLKEEYKQGVRHITITSHYRKDMFDTPRDELVSQFRRLGLWALKDPVLKNVELGLSREYFCDKRLEKLLLDTNRTRVCDPALLPFGKERPVLLIEFTTGHLEYETMEYFVSLVTRLGWIPMIAHVERYRPVQKDPFTVISALKKAGAVIQNNAAAVLGDEGKHSKKLTNELIEKGFTDIVASDAHHIDYRRPNLARAYEYLTKKYGIERAQSLLITMPDYLMHGPYQEEK